MQRIRELQMHAFIQWGGSLSDTYHVLPLNDLKPHVESERCACEPSVENLNGGRLVTHNAYDGREFFEDDAAFDEVSH